MNKLNRKLRSQSGASILLALLFLLTCMMVAASILMAAVSNAGKIRSNYDEQQRYLTLSSALRLVAGEIEEATYTGDYTVRRWEVPILDDDGNPTEEVTKYYRVEQAEGDFTCGELNNSLNFRSELDGVFGREFTGTGYQPLAGTALLPRSETLIVEVKNGDEAKLPAVVVSVGLRQDLRVHLKATLATNLTYEGDGTPVFGGKVYTMEAELAPSGYPTLNDFTPGSDEFPAGSTLPGGAKELSSTPRGTPTEPDIKNWELQWISKEVAEG